MKHSRSEIVKNIVNSYIKRRQYYDSDTFKRGDIHNSRNVEYSVISAMVDSESSLPNSIMYKCVNNDPSVAETQFTNFKSWVNTLHSHDTVDELRSLLFPLLCHFYVEMLLGGHRDAALSFLKKHQTISSEDEFILLEEIAALDPKEKIEDKESVSYLRSSKYQVSLSSHTVHILKQYLSKKAHIILLQVLNFWFDLDEPKSSVDTIPIPTEATLPQANGYQDHCDTDQAQFEEVLKFVNEGPSTSSPLLLYTIHNTDDKLSCATMTLDRSLLTGGYTTSEIRLWSLTERRLEKTKACPGSTVRLATDVDIGTQVNESECFVKSETTTDVWTNDSDAITLRGHNGTVQDLVFIPSSDFLVSVSMDKTMRIWSLFDYSCRAVFKGHVYPIWCVAASPLAGFVATGSHDRTARLWSLERNYPLRIFAGHQQDVDCVRFHPNGNYIATGSSDSSVRLWSTDSGELVRVFDGHRTGVMALAFSPDGNYLATAGDDKKVRVYDLRNSSVTGEFCGHTDTVLSLDWTSDGEFIASCGADHSARIWPVRTCEEDAVTPRYYNIPCNNMCSIKYSSKNTPVCIVGLRNS